MKKPAPLSPYAVPGFYETALAAGRHRDIVGGRWDETGEVQMAILQEAGLVPSDHFLDIGAGSLRLGCRAVPYLAPGHYWATDQSLALMQAGHAHELGGSDRLPAHHLIEDADFAYPGVPDTIDMAMAFAVFTHLPMNHLRRALISARARFPRLRALLFTVFLAPDAARLAQPFRQRDGVVTHDTRPPYHLLAEDALHLTRASGFEPELRPDRLPRGQVLIIARPK